MGSKEMLVVKAIKDLNNSVMEDITPDSSGLIFVITVTTDQGEASHTVGGVGNLSAADFVNFGGVVLHHVLDVLTEQYGMTKKIAKMMIAMDAERRGQEDPADQSNGSYH